MIKNIKAIYNFEEDYEKIIDKTIDNMNKLEAYYYDSVSIFE